MRYYWDMQRCVDPLVTKLLARQRPGRGGAAELARQLGISRQRWWAICRGDRALDRTAIERAIALGLLDGLDYVQEVRRRHVA